MSGWIKIYRTLSESPGYFSESFCRNMAWIDMILIANHKPGFIRKRGIRIDLKRGDIGISLEEMATRWSWSKGKVIRFLNELETDGQIVTQKNNVTSCISIVNYEKYQTGGNANDNSDSNTNGYADDNANGTQTERKQVRNKNVKKGNNEKEEFGSPKLFFVDQLVFPWNTDNFKKSWDRWIRYKKDQYKFIYKSNDSQQAAMDDLFKISKGKESVAIEIINQSIAKSWSGLFELKNQLFVEETTTKMDEVERTKEALKKYQ